MSKQQNNPSPAGIFMISRKIKNNGKLYAEGENAQIVIESDSYEGYGNVISKCIKNDDDLRKKIEELEQAIEAKDKNKITKLLKYIGDKSVDVLIAVMVNRLSS